MNAYTITYRYANKEGAVRTGQHIVEAVTPEAAADAFMAEQKARLRFLQITNIRALLLQYTDDREQGELKLPQPKGKK